MSATRAPRARLRRGDDKTARMGLAVVVLLVALVAGALLGGRVSGLTRLPVGHLRWLGAAFALQLVGVLVADAAVHRCVLLASAGLAVRFAVGNPHVLGIPLATAGLLLNAVVIAVDGGMPVSAYAVARAGIPVDRPAAAPITAGPAARLAVLGAWVPVPLPVLPEADSPGDVLVAAGVGLLVVDGMRRDRRPRRRVTALRARVRCPRRSRGTAGGAA